MSQAVPELSLLDGGSIAYLEQQYEAYLRDPNSVSQSWQAYFNALPPTDSGRDQAHTPVRERFRALAQNNRGIARSDAAPASAAALEHERKQIAVTQLINAYRVRGHQIAEIDPLKRNRKRAGIREVSLEEYSLSSADHHTVFKTPALFGLDQAPLKDIVARLQRTYTASIGYEFMYVGNLEQKQWLLQRIEPVQGKPAFPPQEQRWLLERLSAGEGIERYLHAKFVGQKRFSLEGGESLIVTLSELVRRSCQRNVKELVIGMAHRGRLNTLVNILGKNPAELFSEFEGKHDHHGNNGAGDVKYHQGFSSDVVSEDGKHLHLTMAFNPSHLEIVSPVVEGSVRSRQDRHGDSRGELVIPVVVHGDAAFAGQGVVMETFNMADSRGYSTKGTLHIIVNNQIGFTTSNLEDARSTDYCTDVAKMISAPIFHVNGDDPEAVLFVTQLAMDFRMQFSKDVIIDLVCYRRHGHNEADEPAATQPQMYGIIRSMPTTRTLYAQSLEQTGALPPGTGDAIVKTFRAQLEAGECVAPGVVDKPKKTATLTVDWTPYIQAQDWRQLVPTHVSADEIKRLSDILTDLPEGHRLHPRVNKIVEDRRKMAAGALPMDWGFGETMAYATLLQQGYPVRITGQDCGRGTFFHRHAVLHNQNDGSAHVPLRNLSPDQPNFLVIDSVLSEEAVLAFEYGYASHDPTTLNIWEGQFGDFANGAQVVIDQFIASGETKWGRLCGLCLFLPHGYEGAGPEHSSARVERFLQLCAEDNMQVIMPSTPAQCFHMLRRQMLRPLRRPLIVLTPKSLLRHKLAVSTLEDLSEGHFHNVIDEQDPLDSGPITSIVCCSGKVYYDLLERRRAEALTHVAIVRVEQLYPFPYTDLQDVLARYPNAKELVWCQEEPRNQGSWRATRHRVERVLSASQTLRFAGRAPSPSPASGYASVHAAEQRQLVEQALGLSDVTSEY